MTRVVEGRRGGVASGHALASVAGVAALERGGSSVDAALSMAFTQWVVAAPMCGPGGELFVMHVADDAVTVYGGWSHTPRAFPLDAAIVARGPTASVVPGAVRGAEAAWRGAGRLAWSELFEHAIDHAAGHLVTEWMARSYRSVVDRGAADAVEAITGSRRPPAPGDEVRCRDLGTSLELIAENGPDELYVGELAARVVAAAERDGAHLRRGDLAEMSAVVTDGLRVDLGDVELTVPPPPSQSILAADLLRAATVDDDPCSGAYATATAEVAQRGLTERCITGLGGTATSVAAADDGAAVVVHSLAGVQFGTGWIAGDTGIALGNRVGTTLSTRRDLPASNPTPGAVLTHTLSAALFRSGPRSLLVATPGGDRQFQWLAQSGQRFRNGADLHDIVTGPRWFVCPEGDRFGVPGGIDDEWYLFAEAGVEWSTRAELGRYAVREVESVGGGLQAVEIDATGTKRFGSDPRSGGVALSQGDG